MDEETRRVLDYNTDQDGEWWMSEADFKENFAEVAPLPRRGRQDG